MLGRVISVINMKGGVGKTTIAVNIGYTLSEIFGKKVLLIDIDPQMNATQYTLNMNESMVNEIWKNSNKTIYGILYEDFEMPSMMELETSDRKKEEFSGIFEITDRFHIIPSHLRIMTLNLNEHYNKLQNFINANLRNKYDIIIIDAPPTISAYTKISLIASDAYVVPMKTDYLSLFGLPLLERYIASIRDEFNQDLEFLGIILTMVNPELKIYTDVKNKLMQRREWKNKIFNHELKHKTIVSRALSPEDWGKNLPYIIEIGDKELREQIIDITQEFGTKARVL